MRYYTRRKNPKRTLFLIIRMLTEYEEVVNNPDAVLCISSAKSLLKRAADYGHIRIAHHVREEIIRLYKLRMTVKEISAKCNVSKSYIHKVRAEEGLPYRHNYPKKRRDLAGGYLPSLSRE
jgi:hypothetical protein